MQDPDNTSFSNSFLLSMHLLKEWRNVVSMVFAWAVYGGGPLLSVIIALLALDKVCEKRSGLHFLKQVYFQPCREVLVRFSIIITD